MNTELIKKLKDESEKDVLKLMNNSVFGKSIKDVRKHKHIKLVITKRRRNYLLSEKTMQKTVLREFFNNKNEKNNSTH